MIDKKYCKKSIFNLTSTLAELDVAYACDVFEDSWFEFAIDFIKQNAIRGVKMRFRVSPLKPALCAKYFEMRIFQPSRFNFLEAV